MPHPTFPAFLQLPPILQSHKTACTYANSPQSSLFHLLLGFCYVFCLENALLLSAHSAPLGKNCINTTCSQETCLGPAVCPWHLVLSSTVSGCVQMTRSLSPLGPVLQEGEVCASCKELCGVQANRSSLSIGQPGFGSWLHYSYLVTLG